MGCLCLCWVGVLLGFSAARFDGDYSGLLRRAHAPLQCFMAIYLGERTLPAELKPGLVAKTFLRLTFFFQLLMAGLVVYFVAL